MSVKKFFLTGHPPVRYLINVHSLKFARDFAARTFNDYLQDLEMTIALKKR